MSHDRLEMARSMLARMWAHAFTTSTHTTLCRMVDVSQLAFAEYGLTNENALFTLGCAIVYATHRLATE